MKMSACSTQQRRFFGLLRSLAAATTLVAAGSASGQLVDRKWHPADLDVPVNLLNDTYNWPFLDAQGGPDGRGDMLGKSVSGWLVVQPPGAVAFANTAWVDASVTFGQLVVRNNYWMEESPFTLQRVPGSSGIVTLGNDVGVPALMIGWNTGSAGTYRGKLVLQDLALVSSGPVLLHPNASLAVAGTLWSHGGEVLMGASADPAGRNDGSTLSLYGGSRLVPGIGQRLDIVVGSIGSGTLNLNSMDGVATTIDAQALTIGGEMGQGTLLMKGADSRITARELFRVGRGAEAIATAMMGARIEAKSGLIGDGGPGEARLSLELGSTAHFSRMDGQYGPWWLPGPGDLWVATAAGANGVVFVELAHPYSAASELRVDSSLRIGGDGHGEVQAYGNLVAERIEIGAAGGQGSGKLTTSGALTVGERRVDPEYGRVDYTGHVGLDGHATWVHGGHDGWVHGSVNLGAGGSPDGVGAEMRIRQGASLTIDLDLWVGGYRSSPTSPIATLTVEPGGRLRVGADSEYAVLTIDNTGVLAGGGLIEGNVVVNGGTVSPGMSPGWLKVDGNLSFAGWSDSPGRLVIEIGGTAPGSGHDVLDVSGLLDLGGSTELVLKPYGGFVPEAGQGFAFIRAGQIQGSFATLVDETGLGLVLGDLQFANGLFGIGLANAVPEPAALWLWLAGLALPLWHARRRARAGTPS